MRQTRLILSLFVGAMLSFGGTQALAETPTDLINQAKSQLQAGEAQQAYETLAAEEAEYAGDVTYDYWLGLAAVRAGEYPRATFALERVVAQEPNHAGARLELATAYVALDQNELASSELAQLRTMDPPENAAERIKQLQDAVSRRAENEARKDRTLWLTLEAGHDDNVGTYPEDTLELIPGFQAVIEPIDSAFWGVRGGASQNFDVAPEQKLGFSLQGYTRAHRKDDAEQFDEDFLHGQGRWIRDIDGRQEFELGLEAATLRLDGEKFYNLIGAYSTWRNRVSRDVSYDVTFRGRDIAFEAEANDYTFWSLGVGADYRLSPRLRLGVDIAAEMEAANEDRAGGDAVGGGLGGNLAYALTSTQRVTGQLRYTRMEYDDEVFGGEERTDDRMRASLGWDWFFADDWQSRAEVGFRDQDSSVDLYSYDQTTGRLSITRYF
jgi:tetratricopeptide (TPR) repeat protein